jgi:hypothetical protein
VGRGEVRVDTEVTVKVSKADGGDNLT